MADNNNDTNTSNRGFASMSKQKQREIASMGGKASGGSRKKASGDSNRSSSETDQSNSDNR